ncbi:hypothetical protein FQZ97_1221250 [compost metagenome]
MRFLGSRGGAAGQYARDHHQAMGADFGGVRGMRYRFFAVDGAGADNGRNASFNQATDAFLALSLGQQGPVTHGAAVHNGAHTD